MSILKQILGQNSHWQVNKDISRAFGIEAAVLLSDLIDKWIYHGYPEWFYNTSDNIQNDTTLTRRQQEKVIGILQSNQLIEFEVRGTPPKKHFKVLENNILNVFKEALSQNVQNVQINLAETYKLNCTNRTNKNVQNVQQIRINNNNNNNKNKNKEISNALHFLEDNYPLEFESLMMKYQSKIQDFDKAKNDFNLQFDVENRNYELKIINSRAQLFFNRWIENDRKYKTIPMHQNANDLSENNPSRKRFQM